MGPGMTHEPKVAVQFQAMSVAMRAKSSDLDATDVHELVTLAQQLLADDDPIFLAVTTFATQHEIYARDPDHLIRIGGDLHDAISRTAVPVPPDMDRADING